MLSPNTRSLYTAALTPPPGFAFDEAIGTTFSLDPGVLLTVPLHLALLGGQRASTMRDGIALFEAVRRLAGRITVYAQRGRLLVPSPPNPLYALVEAMAVEVNAPRGGVFHPKLWVLRFVDPDGAPLLRLMVLSRNLTHDRSWDVALTLEGKPAQTAQDLHPALADFVGSLPTLAVDAVDAARTDQAERLAAELRRTRWEPPPGFDAVSFHVLGRGPTQGWKPAWSSRAAIISPFCADSALQWLGHNMGSADALVSRPETLLALAPETRARFKRCLTLADAAETEDGEDTSSSAHDTLGLHAKVYVFERGWNTHVVLGSANATTAALEAGRNIEVLAELVGKRSRVGGIDALLGTGGLGEVLVDAPAPGPPPLPDPAEQAAQEALEAARTGLARAPLRVRCIAGEADTWDLHLDGLAPAPDGRVTARAWPITVPQDHAVALWPAPPTAPVVMSGLALASVTGLIAFDLRAPGHDLHLRFVLNLPVDGLPEGRDGAILQTVVRNRDGFLRYLMLLLGELGLGADADGRGGDSALDGWAITGPGGPSLLEELVRAYSRAPERLRDVQRVIDQLTAPTATGGVVPPEFLTLWRVFERALEGRLD